MRYVEIMLLFPENLEKASRWDAYEIIQANIDTFVDIVQPYIRCTAANIYTDILIYWCCQHLMAP